MANRCTGFLDFAFSFRTCQKNGNYDELSALCEANPGYFNEYSKKFRSEEA